MILITSVETATKSLTFNCYTTEQTVEFISSFHFFFAEQTYTLNIPWHIGNHHPRHVQYTVHGIPEIQTLRLKRNDNINLNVPTCVIDQGFTICEYGNVQVSAMLYRC